MIMTALLVSTDTSVEKSIRKHVDDFSVSVYPSHHVYEKKNDYVFTSR